MKSILIVEDEKAMAEALGTHLSARGYAIMLASDGEEAIRFIENGQPDMILCDRRMPKVSGLEFLGFLRKRRPDMDNVPFVFLSGLDDRRDIHAAVDFRPAAYLTKPVSFDELDDTIDELMSGRRSLISVKRS